jgi:hypothetical protein
MNLSRLMAGILATVLLAGCSESNWYPGSRTLLDEAGTMRLAKTCFWQASKITHLRQGAIFIHGRVETPDGPVLLMEAAGITLSCRPDGVGGVLVSRAAAGQADLTQAVGNDPSWNL